MIRYATIVVWIHHKKPKPYDSMNRTGKLLRLLKSMLVFAQIMMQFGLLFESGCEHSDCGLKPKALTTAGDHGVACAG